MGQKMKKSQAVIALLAGGALLLSACGNNSGSGSKAASSPSATAGSSAGSSATASAGDDDAAANLKPYKLTLIYPGSASADLQLVQDEMSKYLTEKINATIELKPIDWAPGSTRRI